MDDDITAELVFRMTLAASLPNCRTDSIVAPVSKLITPLSDFRCMQESHQNLTIAELWGFTCRLPIQIKEIVRFTDKFYALVRADMGDCVGEGCGTFNERRFNTTTQVSARRLTRHKDGRHVKVKKFRLVCRKMLHISKSK